MSIRAMETPKTDSLNMADMIMCGDHPSFTKTEFNAKEVKSCDKVKIKVPVSHPGLSPTSSASRTERAQPRAPEPGEPAPRHEPLPANKALVHAALGSFRWPPYLLCVWVLVLLLTHALHALVAALDAALPPLRKLCIYFRTWTEDSWKLEVELNRKVVPLAVGGATGLLYALYCALYALHAVALWSVEPLCAELDEQSSGNEIAKVTNYLEDASSKTNFVLKR